MLMLRHATTFIQTCYSSIADTVRMHNCYSVFFWGDILHEV